jgi:uncharacterized protein YndB with AHSA1/START domain
MPSLKIDTHIAAERDRVFEALLDTANYEHWLTLHERWPDGPPTVSEGGSFEQDVKMLGRSARLTWTVAELAPPSSFVLDGVGPMKLTMRVAYRLDDVQGGTALRYESDVDGGPIPLTGRVGALALKKVKATGEDTMANLKAHVETAQLTATLAAPRALPRRARALLPRFGWGANAEILAAIEENTRAINALTQQIAQSTEQFGRLSWPLTAPLDLLRRGSADSTQQAGEKADG